MAKAQHKSRQPVMAAASLCSGEGGIRTPGRVAPTPVFKTGAFGHSATSPDDTIRIADDSRLVDRSQNPASS